MKIDFVSREILPDGVNRFLYRVAPQDLLYTGYLLESLEGLCIYTTPDKKERILQIDVTPDYLSDFQIIMRSLQDFIV